MGGDAHSVHTLCIAGGGAESTDLGAWGEPEEDLVPAVCESLSSVVVASLCWNLAVKPFGQWPHSVLCVLRKWCVC